jgi:phenol 2-monooxygenase
VIEVLAVLQQDHRELTIEALPAFLMPRKGRYRLIDYEKVFCPDLKSRNDLFDLRSIDRGRGCMVVVRPDQYVASVLPLDAFVELAEFFSAFMAGV